VGGFFFLKKKCVLGVFLLVPVIPTQILNVENLDIQRIERNMPPMVHHRIKVVVEVALSELLKFH
jgi:hypothetical protein